MTGDLTLNDLEHLLAVRGGRGISGDAADAILGAALERLRAAYTAAASALAYGDGDLRPALRRLVREYAEVHGRTAAEQVQAFVAECHELFLGLSMRAWGLDLEV